MKGHKHKKQNIALLLLLAVLCIGTAELAACRHFEPQLYQQITAPVRAAAETAGRLLQGAAAYTVQRWNTVQAELASLQQELEARWAEARARRAEAKALAGEEPDDQAVSQPVLDNPVTYTPVTQLLEEGGRQILTGGVVEVTYFNQGDEAWAEQPYGTDDIGRYGCGPTAMAMVVSTLTGEVIDPAAMAQWAVDHGYWARKSGSYHSIVEGIAQDFGLEAQSLSDWTPDTVREVLSSGKLLVALMGPGHFTQRGHFIVLRGVTSSGNVLVADPSSLERSLTTWDPQLILDELSRSRTNGAPLWTAAPPSS